VWRGNQEVTLQRFHGAHTLGMSNYTAYAEHSANRDSSQDLRAAVR
jgi:hypothetical protein